MGTDEGGLCFVHEGTRRRCALHEGVIQRKGAETQRLTVESVNPDSPSTSGFFTEGNIGALNTTNHNHVANLPALPDGWAWNTLGEISEKPQYGWTTKATYDGGEVKLLRTTDITSGRLDWSSVPYCTVEPDSLDKYLLNPGDIVISRAGSVGFSYLLTDVERAVFASYLIRFRVESNIDKKYVYYFLQSPSYWSSIRDSKAGIAVPNVNAKKLARVPIPIAPPDQQKRIVAEIEKQFSRLDEAVANLHRAKANLKRYKAAILKAAVEGRLVETEADLARREGRSYETSSQLLERVLEARRSQWKGKGKYKEPAAPNIARLPELPDGWVWASPSQLSDGEPYSLAIGPFGSNLKVNDYATTGVPLVFVRNIRTASFGGTDTVFVTPEKAKALSAHKVTAGDLLVTKMGNPPGDVCMYPDDRPDAIITADCIKLRLAAAHLESSFFVYAIQSQPIRKQVLSITKGVAQRKVSLARFRSIAVPLPPVAEQRRILAEVDRKLSFILEIEGHVDADLVRAERLRQSVLKQAFSGRLVPGATRERRSRASMTSGLAFSR